MTAKIKKGQNIVRWGFLLAVYIYSLVSSYANGRQRMFYLLLAEIPLLFLCWGLNRLLSGTTIREIQKHLTAEERAESNRLVEAYAGRLAIFAGFPFAILGTELYMRWGVTRILPYVVLFCIFMGLASPFMFKHRKAMRKFMLSTEYSKRQGYDVKAADPD